MAVQFRNDGAIDVRSITTFGVSAKNTANPIGYFGTGLKYALAILAREGCKVWLEVNGQRFSFSAVKMSMRGKSFEVVTMNDMELPFTTELGKNWELWQAFRELYCNALDEPGWAVGLGSPEDLLGKPSQGKTVWTVEGEEFEKLTENLNDIFLGLSADIRLADAPVQIFDRPSKYVYYRGIRVHELEVPSLFTYNIITDCVLTEDRTFANAWEALTNIPAALARLENRDAVYRALTAPKSCYEHDVTYSQLLYGGTNPSEEFAAVLEREFKANNDQLNAAAADYQRKVMKASALKHYELADLSVVEKKQLAKSMKALRKAFPDIDQYSVKTVRDLGESTMALADRSERAIVISKRCFALGTKFLASTILEEYAHLKTGHADFTRGLQTFLFDSICTLIENHITEEPL